MTPARSQELIVGCLAASTAVAAGSMMAEGNMPGVRLALGAAFTGVGLATLSMFSPDIAGAFATLVLTTTVFVYGQPLMDLVSTYISQRSPAPTRQEHNPA